MEFPPVGASLSRSLRAQRGKPSLAKTLGSLKRFQGHAGALNTVTGFKKIKGFCV